MKTKILFMALLSLFMLTSSKCSDSEPEVKPLPPVETPDTPDQPGNEEDDPLVLPEREKPTFKGKIVVGYYPTWSTWWGEPDYDKLSIICLAFAEMRGDGHLYYDGYDAVKHVITNAHKKNVKVLVSLRDAQNVSKALADEKLRKNLAKEVKYCIHKYNLDGVDVDYEEWGGDENAKRQNLEKFYTDIRAQIGEGYLLTAALGGKTHADSSIDAQLLSHLDYVFPMIYDACGGWEGGGWGEVGQHSSFQYFKDVIAFYTGTLKVPKEKLCAGMPFYGYEFKFENSTKDAVSVAYRDLFGRFPDVDVANTDNIGLIWYNGIPTIKEKCQYVLDNGIGGVMIWELSQDTREPATSLLNAVHTTLNKK